MVVLDLAEKTVLLYIHEYLLCVLYLGILQNL